MVTFLISMGERWDKEASLNESKGCVENMTDSEGFFRHTLLIVLIITQWVIVVVPELLSNPFKH